MGGCIGGCMDVWMHGGLDVVMLGASKFIS